METLTLDASVSDLITSLQSALPDSDLSGAERILSSWAESLKSDLSKPLTEELFLMEVEKAELDFKVSRLEKELDLVQRKNVSLQGKVSNFSEIMEEFKKRVVFESIQKGCLEIRVFSLENELELVQKENVALNEKVMSLSKVAEKIQPQRSMGEKGGKDEDCFANKTPTKRAFRAVCSDSESDSDVNLPIGEIFNIKRVNEEDLVVKNAGSRKRRLVQVGEIEGHRVSGSLTVGNVPGPTSEPGESGFTLNPEIGSNERCELDDFSDTEDYGGCEMNKADSSGSSVPRKMSSRKRNRKLKYFDTEEEKDETKGSESGDQLDEGGYMGGQRTTNVAPEKIYMNLDDLELEEEADTESDSEGDSLGGFIVSRPEPECDNPNPPFRERELHFGR